VPLIVLVPVPSHADRLDVVDPGARLEGAHLRLVEHGREAVHRAEHMTAAGVLPARHGSRVAILLDHDGVVAGNRIPGGAIVREGGCAPRQRTADSQDEHERATSHERPPLN
jgi:hypothetical protein